MYRQEDIIKYMREHPEDWNAARVTDDTMFMRYDWYKEKEKNRYITQIQLDRNGSPKDAAPQTRRIFHKGNRRNDEPLGIEHKIQTLQEEQQWQHLMQRQ